MNKHWEVAFKIVAIAASVTLLSACGSGNSSTYVLAGILTCALLLIPIAAYTHQILSGQLLAGDSDDEQFD